VTYGSLFSGVGGFDLGFDRAGMRCAWQVEIDPTARDVLARHWPDVPKFNDVRECGARNLEPVDVICGGSPCQGFSVAGKRGGINDDRSGLFGEMVRVVAELNPKYVVWENVPGVVSGYDEVAEHAELIDWASGRELAVEPGGLVRLWWLGAILRSFADIGYGGAYRILNAQWFGVPQRRRRIFAVFARDADGHSGAERCAEILALRESVPGNPVAGKEAGEDVAGCLGGGSGKRGWCNDSDRTTFVTNAEGSEEIFLTRSNIGKGVNNQTPLIAHALTANGFDASEDGTGRGTPLVVADTVRSHPRPGSNSVGLLTFTVKDHGADAGELAPTLRWMGHDKSHANRDGQVAVAFAERGTNVSVDGEIAATMKANGNNTGGRIGVHDRKGVRRLTPLECERMRATDVLPRLPHPLPGRRA